MSGIHPSDIAVLDRPPDLAPGVSGTHVFDPDKAITDYRVPTDTVSRAVGGNPQYSGILASGLFQPGLVLMT